MDLKKLLSRNFIISLAVIILVNAASLVFLETNQYKHTSLVYGIVSCICIIVVGYIGYKALAKLPEKWPSAIWLLFYFVLFPLACLVKYVGVFLLHLSHDANTIMPVGLARFCCSPLCFITLYLVARRFSRNSTPSLQRQKE